MLGHVAQSVGGALPGSGRRIAALKPRFIAGASAAAASVPIPAFLPGDLLVGIGSINGGNMPTAPSGWVTSTGSQYLWTNSATSSRSIGLSHKIAVGDEVNFGAGNSSHNTVFVFRDAVFLESNGHFLSGSNSVASFNFPAVGINPERVTDDDVLISPLVIMVGAVATTQILQSVASIFEIVADGKAVVSTFRETAPTNQERSYTLAGSQPPCSVMAAISGKLLR